MQSTYTCDDDEVVGRNHEGDNVIRSVRGLCNATNGGRCDVNGVRGHEWDKAISERYSEVLQMTWGRLGGKYNSRICIKSSIAMSSDSLIRRACAICHSLSWKAVWCSQGTASVRNF